MSTKLELHAQSREDVGKGASRRLRRQGERIPGILYGGGADPVKLTLENRELSKVMMNEAFFSQILDLSVDGKAEQVILRDLQRNPANDKVMHIDLLRIRADRALQVSVPLHFVNEDKCEGVRLEGGSISHLLNEVEISCWVLLLVLTVVKRDRSRHGQSPLGIDPDPWSTMPAATGSSADIDCDRRRTE